MPDIAIRDAARADVPVILGFIRELAAYERQPDAVQATEADLLRDGFAERPRFEARIAELDGTACGFTLFFHNYSTWEGRPGLYLEDLYVQPRARRYGVGRRLVVDVARLAVARGCGRLDFNVLDWNPARDFYAALGVDRLDEWLPYRASGERLRALAAGGA